jgi:RNA-directed DNA polymerase
MIPTMKILENVKRNSSKNKDEVFTRLYRYMLRADLYYVAYQNLYANNGASTKGVNNDTADGFSEDKIAKIIESLANETYMPTPARRTYIKKTNGKMRPLGIPTFTDKLVQEVLRMILESVYEPVFLNCSHGFRPSRSCHTALQSLKKEFTGARWFVEGDIKRCFDNIDHQALVEIVNMKIKDARLVKLIYKMLKTGYIEDWLYQKTYSGTPQGGIISPLFANIYLHELDKFVERVAKDFYQPSEKKYTDEYTAIHNRMNHIKYRLNKASGVEKEKLLAQLKSARAELLTTPAKLQTDKKIKYIRYADDFIIGVNGSKSDCVLLKQRLTDFIATQLKMELSEEKTLITHSNKSARFLGYQIRVRRNGEIRPSGKDSFTQRTLNGTVELSIPFDDKIMEFMFCNGIIKQVNGEIRPAHRNPLLHCTELEIMTTYNAELRGICNYYSMASNFYKLNYFAYLMEYSCLKTLAAKHNSGVAKIREQYKDGSGKWCIPYETKQGVKRCYFANYADCKRTKNPSDKVTNAATEHRLTRTTMESRLAAKICELCGSTDAEHYEIHHVHKVKDLKGKELWEQMMIAKRRKTMVLCECCHKKIHSNGVSKTEQ